MTPSLIFSIHDPATLSLPERLEVAQLDAVVYSFAMPEDPPLVLESMAEELGIVGEDDAVRLVLARQGGQLVGRAGLDYSLTQNVTNTGLSMVVHPDHRRRGVGLALAERAGRLATELGRTSYMTATSTRAPQGETFAARLGAKAALEMITSDLLLGGPDRSDGLDQARLDQAQLDQAQLDQAQLRRWVDRPEQDAYVLHRYTQLPEHDLERLAALMEVMNTAPRGELEFDDWKITPAMLVRWQQMTDASGESQLLYALEHLESRELVGYTQVFWHPGRASLVYQGATAVRPDHRQHGLGKWLKAAVLLDMPEAFPGAERVRTGNADSNAAMLGINRALGFAPAYGRTEWQGQTQELLTRAVERRNPLSI